MKEPLILLTNDDGIDANGLRALVEMARPLGKLLVVAPEEGHSGQSHAITTKNPIRLRKITDYGVEGIEVYACSGTPVDCVKLGMTHLLSEQPNLVLSGINHGSNASVSVIYSGTMAAAQEASLYGIPAIGFSLNNHHHDANFEACVQVGHKITRQVLTKGLEYEVCLNVNFPDISLDKFQGVKFCRQANGTWTERYDRRVDPNGGEYFWLTGTFTNNEPSSTDTDEWALNNNYVAITPIQPDMTSYKELELAASKWNDFKL
ncbi:MAG: 5'/3'-nucleotidase SurE [Bacteroidales bacterium]